MTWVAVAVGGTALVGTAVQADSSRRAANQQRDAANAASQVTQAGTDQASAGWNDAFNQSLAAQKAALAQYNPMQQAAYETALRAQEEARARMYTDSAGYRQTGTEALTQLQSLLGYDPTPTAESVMAQPGYQAGLRQGRGVIEGSAAARGGLYSGQALKELTQYGNDYATTKYGTAFDQAQSSFAARWGRLAGLANMGQTENARVSSADQAYANNIGSLATGNAQRQGGALLDAAGNETALRTGRASAIGNLATGNANNLGNIWTSNANAQGAAQLQQGAIYSNGINQLAGLAQYGLNRNGTNSASNWGVGTTNPYGGTAADPWYS